MKQQAKTICLFLTALTATGFIFFNCSKINADGSQAYLNQSPSDAFLQVPAHSNPIFSRIAAAIRAQDSQQHFLNNIAVKEGIPRWEGSTILANAADVRSAAAGSANNSSGVSGDTVVLVPLVKANTSYVNSFLACKVNDTVTIRLFRGKDYAKFGFGSSGNGLTAESMAMQMMTLQKQSFGHRMFSIGDKRLFNRLANGKIPKRTFVKIGKEPVQGAASSNTNNVLSLTVPVTTTTCEDMWVSNDDGEVVGCPPGDPNCNGGHYETQCQSTTYWIDIIDNAGGGGVPLSDGNNNNNNNPNGNGGSSNNGNTGSPECPDGNWWCALSDYRILNGIVVTEEFFPGIELGYPWLWWESGNFAIIDSLKGYPCAQSILAKLPTINSEVNKIMHDIFGVTDSINLAFQIETSFTKDSADGITPLPSIPNWNSHIYNQTISLNPWVLKNSSREYILITIFHEAIHAYINFHYYKYTQSYMDSTTFKNMFPIFWQYKRVLRTHADTAQHNEMANNYISKMKNAIQSFNPAVSDTIANGLAWGGLHMTTAWMMKPDTNAVKTINLNGRDTTNLVYKTYNLTRCN